MLFWGALVGPISAQDEPERNASLESKEWEALSNQSFIPEGSTALEIKPDRWKHGETSNFILHYRRETEARKVAREIEFALWHAATILGKKASEFGPKSHVFIFENEEEWKLFLSKTQAPPWAAAFARGGDLFLEVRESGNDRFNAPLVAHEVTHAVVTRLYPDKRWPLWLNEGFAEYVGSTSMAARRGQYQKRGQGRLQFAPLTPFELEQYQEYPEEITEVTRLYEGGEKFVRFLINHHGNERFRLFLNALLEGKSLRESFFEVYGAEYPAEADLTKAYERFTR